jgi:putative transposase
LPSAPITIADPIGLWMMERYSSSLDSSSLPIISTNRFRSIRKNAGVNRFVYNRLVGVNREMYELSKTAQYSQQIVNRDRLLYLKSAYGTTSQMRIAIPFLNDPDIDCFSIANAKQDYQKAWSQFRKVPSTGFPAFKRRSNSFSYGTKTVLTV